MSMSAKEAALQTIGRLPDDVSPDEITGALWVWAQADTASAELRGVAERRLAAANPTELVIANRAARYAVVLGASRQIASDIVRRLPEHASLDDILVAITLWREPDDTV